MEGCYLWKRAIINLLVFYFFLAERERDDLDRSQEKDDRSQEETESEEVVRKKALVLPTGGGGQGGRGDVEVKAAEAVEVKAAEERLEVAIARGYSHPRTVRTPVIVRIAWPRPSTSGIGTCPRE